MPKTPNAFLITNKSNIAYLSNFTGSSGFMLLTKTSKYLFTDFRYIERAKNTIKKGIKLIDITKLWRNEETLKNSWQKILKKHNIRSLGVEESNLTVERYKKFKKISNIKGRKISFINTSGKIETQREIKSKLEISLIEKSQRINEKTFLLIKNFIQASLAKNRPISEMDIAWKIKETGYKLGSEEVSFDPIVSFGKHTSMPHHLPDKTRLKKGDIILIDMGMKYKGYCSDMTRMIFTKSPTEEQKKIYNLVLKAQETAIQKIKAGITGNHADKYARDIIVKAGYGETFGHGGGHGVGLDIHEIPSLSENYTQKLKENSIITVEPGIYLEGKFGVRIEDMVLVKKTGVKNLTKIPKKI
jgi:Xaa-Pro aminopeptidase